MRRNDFGDGDPCPGDAGRPADRRHGNMFMLPSKRQYCANQTHDADRSANLFENDGRTPVRRTK